MNAPIIYNYSPITNEFTNSGFADPDPLVPDNWLYPAYCTTVEPHVTTNNEVNVWNGNSWSVYPDHRGETWWKYGIECIIDFIGDPTDYEYTRESPPEALPKHIVRYNNITNTYDQIPDHRGETWWVFHNVPVFIDFIGDPAERGLFPEEPENPVPEITQEPIEEEPLTFGQIKTNAYRQIVYLANTLTNHIIYRYPEAERAKWLDKEKEARAFFLINEEDRTINDAPLLCAITYAQFGNEISIEDTLIHITNKAQSVIDNANQWINLSAFVEGFRSRYDILIDNAINEDDIILIINNATAEIESAKLVLGL